MSFVMNEKHPTPSPPDTDAVGEPKKSYRTILNEQVQEELHQLERPTTGLSISGLSAGLDVGFSVLLMGVMHTLLAGMVAEPFVRLAVANMYAVGFIFVILGRSELFTEHTTLAVLPVLGGRAPLRALGRLWLIIYLTNVIGGTIFALLVATAGPELGVVSRDAFAAIAAPLRGYPWWVVLLSGTLAGWLMGLLSWLVTASRDTISQIVLVWLITTGIGLAHLHHSIVGTIELMAAYFSGGTIGLLEVIQIIALATLGNAIGGIVFVALIKYGHASKEGQASKPT